MAKVILDFERPILELEQKIMEMRNYADNLDIADEIATLEQKVDQLRMNVYNTLTRWQRVQLARHPDRPYTLDYIQMMTEDFIELHGDRRFGDDRAIVAGFCKIEKFHKNNFYHLLNIKHHQRVKLLFEDFRTLARL